MKKVHLIVVGKLKDQHIEKLEKDFTQRIKSFDFTVHELKASAEDKKSEAKLILRKIQDLSKQGSAKVVALTEFGKERDSVKFSQWVFSSLENANQLVFIIAGAEGFDASVIESSHEQVSLSKLTFPHKLARLLFIEQLYRAITIQEGHPYHN